MTGPSSNSPFARRRAKGDLVNALPAFGIVLGAVLGVLYGATQGVGGPVSCGGIGITAGLALGIALRNLLAPRRP